MRPRPRLLQLLPLPRQTLLLLLPLLPLLPLRPLLLPLPSLLVHPSPRLGPRSLLRTLLAGDPTSRPKQRVSLLLAQLLLLLPPPPSRLLLLLLLLLPSRLLLLRMEQARRLRCTSRTSWRTKSPKLRSARRSRLSARSRMCRSSAAVRALLPNSRASMGLARRLPKQVLL